MLPLGPPQQELLQKNTTLAPKFMSGDFPTPSGGLPGRSSTGGGSCNLLEPFVLFPAGGGIALPGEPFPGM